MAIRFASVGHFFASSFRDIYVAARAVVLAGNKVQTYASQIETVTALVPIYGTEAAEIERLAFAALGALAALLQSSGGSKTVAKSTTIDPALLEEVEAYLAKNPQLVQQAAVEYKALSSPAA